MHRVECVSGPKRDGGYAMTRKFFFFSEMGYNAYPLEALERYGYSALLFPKLAKPEPNRRFRARSALGRAGYFWMICRSTSARIFPQRGCKLN